MHTYVAVVRLGNKGIKLRPEAHVEPPAKEEFCLCVGNATRQVDLLKKWDSAALARAPRL